MEGHIELFGPVLLVGATLVFGGVRFAKPTETSTERALSSPSAHFVLSAGGAPSASWAPPSAPPTVARPAPTEDGTARAVAATRVRPEPSVADARAVPLSQEAGVLDLVARFQREVIDQAGHGALREVYADPVRFRTFGPHYTPERVGAYWAMTFDGTGSLTIDQARSRVRVEREGEEPSARATCVDPVDAEGPLYKIRLWATEYSASRPADVGCPSIEGVYILRARRIGGALRVCHETWSLREGICASCPSARACAGRGAPTAESVGFL